MNTALDLVHVIVLAQSSSVVTTTKHAVCKNLIALKKSAAAIALSTILSLAAKWFLSTTQNSAAAMSQNTTVFKKHVTAQDKFVNHAATTSHAATQKRCAVNALANKADALQVLQVTPLTLLAAMLQLVDILLDSLADTIATHNLHTQTQLTKLLLNNASSCTPYRNASCVA